MFRELTTVKSAFNSILKETRKGFNDAVKNAWFVDNSNDLLCVCDGYRFYRVGGVKRLVKEGGASDSFNEWLSNCTIGTDYHKWLHSTVFKDLADNNVVEMPTPDLEAVKSFAQLRKGKRSVREKMFDMGRGLPCANIDYIVDALRLFPVAQWFVNKDIVRRSISPIYVVCYDGRLTGAIAILPIRTNEKVDELNDIAVESTASVVKQETPADHSAEVSPAVVEQNADTMKQSGNLVIVKVTDDMPKFTASTADEGAEKVPSGYTATMTSAGNIIMCERTEELVTASIDQDETPADHSVPEDITPDPDPKQAHGPIPEKTFAGTSIERECFKIIFDDVSQRTRVIVPDEYKEKARVTIEEAGFYYSPKMDSWNKKLTFKAYRAAQKLVADLDKLFAA